MNLQYLFGGLAIICFLVSAIGEPYVRALPLGLIFLTVALLSGN